MYSLVSCHLLRAEQDVHYPHMFKFPMFETQVDDFRFIPASGLDLAKWSFFCNKNWEQSDLDPYCLLP